MEENSVKNSEKRELNLLDLIVMAARWTKQTCICLFNVFLKTVRFGIQNWWIVGSFTIVMLVGGFFLTTPKHMKMKGEATLLFAPQNRATVANNLNRLATVRMDIEKTQRLLGIDDSTARKLRKLEIYNFCYSKQKYNNNLGNEQDNYESVFANRIVGEVDKKNTMSSMDDTTFRVIPDRFLVSIKAKNTNDFDPIFEKLEAYLLAQPEIVANHNTFVKEKQEQYNYFSNEIQRLDSLANILYFRMPTETQLKMDNKLVVGEARKQLFYGEIEGLQSKKQQVAYELNTYSAPVSYLSNSAILYPNRWLHLFLWTVVGMVFGYITALCVRYRKEINAYMKQK